MEKKRITKHQDHHKNRKAHHKPLDAYAQYELEHKPHTPVELPSFHPSPPSPESPNGFEKKRMNRLFGLESLDHSNSINYENIDVEAGEFLAYEHHKFKDRKSTSSMNTYEKDSYMFTDETFANNSDWSMYNRPNQWSRYPEF